jgi:ABC-type transport system substrate-binding protein
MRIRSGGQITTGTSQPAMVSAAALHQTSYNSGTNWAFLYNDLRSSSGTSTIGYFYRNGSPVGSIQSSASSVAYNTSSDYRLKENVDYTWDATTRLKQLKPARFNFIADPDTTVDGFLAHEAQSVVPESVHGTKDGMRDETDEEGNVTSVPDMQGIDQSKLVPLLVKTIQELEARITALEDA